MRCAGCGVSVKVKGKLKPFDDHGPRYCADCYGAANPLTTPEGHYDDAIESAETQLAGIRSETEDPR